MIPESSDEHRGLKESQPSPSKVDLERIRDETVRLVKEAEATANAEIAVNKTKTDKTILEMERKMTALAKDKAKLLEEKSQLEAITGNYESAIHSADKLSNLTVERRKASIQVDIGQFESAVAHFKVCSSIDDDSMPFLVQLQNEATLAIQAWLPQLHPANLEDLKTSILKACATNNVSSEQTTTVITTIDV